MESWRIENNRYTSVSRSQRVTGWEIYIFCFVFVAAVIANKEALKSLVWSLMCRIPDVALPGLGDAGHGPQLLHLAEERGQARVWQEGVVVVGALLECQVQRICTYSIYSSVGDPWHFCADPDLDPTLDPLKNAKKKFVLKLYFASLIAVRPLNTLIIIIKREGSGAGSWSPLNNESGSGRPKNMRIRIPKTGI